MSETLGPLSIVIFVLTGVAMGVGGAMQGVYFSPRWLDTKTPLEACRQQHNVYQCEMIAVPVEQNDG